MFSHNVPLKMDIFWKVDNISESGDCKQSETMHIIPFPYPEHPNMGAIYETTNESFLLIIMPLG